MTAELGIKALIAFKIIGDDMVEQQTRQRISAWTQRYTTNCAELETAGKHFGNPIGSPQFYRKVPARSLNCK